MTKPEIIAGIYEHYDDLSFIEDVNNLTFFRKSQLKKALQQLNQKNYEAKNN